MKKPDLSVVLPCYNEGLNIPIIVERLSRFWPEINFELILVNNGSTDDSEKVLAKMEKDNEFLRVVTVIKNVGYGHGIMSGLKEARADVVAYSHADIQTPPEDIIKAYHLFKESGDHSKHILIKGLRVNRRKEDQSLTKGLEKVAGLLLGYRMDDINGQPKLFPRELIKNLTHSPLDFSFDVYVMYKAIQNGFEIVKFPVDFGLRIHGESKWASSSVKKYKTILGYLKNILVISLKNTSDKNNTIRQFIKFSIAGVFGSVSNYGIFYLLYKTFNFYYVLASLCGYFLAGVIIFLINRQWTFNTKYKNIPQQSLNFFLLISSTFVLNGLVIFLLTDFINIRAEISQVITMIFTMICNFIGSKFWVFKQVGSMGLKED